MSSSDTMSQSAEHTHADAHLKEAVADHSELEDSMDDDAPSGSLDVHAICRQIQ